MSILLFLARPLSERIGGDAAGRRLARSLATSPGMEPSRARAPGGVVYGPQSRYSPPASPNTVRPPTPRAAARADFVALARGWGRVLTPNAWISVHETPHPIVAAAWRWAPIVMPAVVGSALLTLALAFLARGPSPYAPLPQDATIPALLGVYLVGGLLLGLALRFAPNGVVWSLLLIGGPALQLTIMLTIVLGAPGGLLTLGLIAALLLIYSGVRRSIIRPGVMQVTLLLGEWYRTLLSGYNVLLPGEQIITTVGAAPRSFTTPMQRVALAPDRVAQARATISYVVNPHEAWRTAAARATWEDELRQRVNESVHATLTDWRVSPDGALIARGSIARQTLEETRGWANSVGVRILSVRAHDIAIGSPGDLQPIAEPSASRATPRAVAGAPTGAPTAVTPTVSAATPTGAPSRTPSVAPPTPTPRRTPAQAMDRPSPAVLEDLYEAVRNRQITDTQVIREIAGHFARMAREPQPANGALPFDPISAARLLDDYAEALDAARASPPPATRGR